MVNWVERSMDNYLALTKLKIRYNLISGEYNQIAWPFQRGKKNVLIFSLKRKKKQSKTCYPTSETAELISICPPWNTPYIPTEPQLLLDDRTACIWATVRIPIVHFSVLLVFKESATQHWTIPDPVCRNSHPNPSQKMAEHRSGISR